MGSTVHIAKLVRACAIAAITLDMACRAAGAPTVEATPVPAPKKPDFSSMQYLIGSWNCTSKSSRRPAASTFTTTNSLDSTGFWMIGQDIGHKTSWFPYETKGVDMMTYDSDAKYWVDIYTDNHGGYGAQTSPGVHGKTIVWTDAFFSPYGNVVSESPTAETWVSPTKRLAHSTFTERTGRVNTVDTMCTRIQ